MSTEYFPGQEPDEKILTIVRPYWMNLIGPLAIVLVAAILPPAIIALGGAVDAPTLSGSGRAIVTALLGGYYATLATVFFIRWLSVYLDVGVVSDKRVVDVDQRKLFSRNVAELDSKMVQDVAAEKSGFLRTIFDFGDVIIQTAGERPNFTFEGVHHPEEVVNLIQHSVADRGHDEGAVADEAAETMAEAAEKMKEAAESIAEQPATESAAPEAAADAPVAPTSQTESNPGPQPQKPEATTPPPPTTENPPSDPDVMQDLPREFDK